MDSDKCQFADTLCPSLKDIKSMMVLVSAVPGPLLGLAVLFWKASFSAGGMLRPFAPWRKRSG